MKRKGIPFITLIIAMTLGLLCSPLYAKSKKEIKLTIYNDNRALVTEYRQIYLKKGVNEVRITDVPARIDPTSVHFMSITDPENTVVLEQNFEYDLVSTAKLLNKYIGQDVRVVTKKGNTHEGNLLGVAGGVILEGEDKAITVINSQNISETIFPSLPQGLITKPALMWQIYTKKKGKHNVEIAYITSGVTWSADYILSLSKDDSHANLNGWITINNKAGSTFTNSHMKLVAGTLHRPTAPPREEIMYAKMVRAPSREVKQRTLFEYHLYDVARPVTLKDNQTKQIEFITRPGVCVEKRFVLDSRSSYFSRTRQKEPIEVQLRFKNTKDSGLGIPLPSGKIRIYKEDIDGSLQLIGEDKIGHTPKGETVSLIAGRAFDIVGKRTKVKQKNLGSSSRSETWDILVKNHKDKPVEVHLIERLSRWSEWEIIKETLTHKKIDAGTVEYLLKIPAGDSANVTYTVIYRW